MKDNAESWAAILLGALGVLAIVSIFDDDSSKIVSSRGKKILSDKDRMKEINEKISVSEGDDQYKEVFI